MRNYTEEPLSAAAPPVQAPEPGTGTVFIAEDHDGTWRASWQAGERCAEIEGVGEAVAREWASSRQAASVLVFSPEKDAYQPL